MPRLLRMKDVNGDSREHKGSTQFTKGNFYQSFYLRLKQADFGVAYTQEKEKAGDQRLVFIPNFFPCSAPGTR